MRIDLNADLGESFGAWTLGDDGALLTAVSSANVACGFHAGDPSVIRRTIDLAVQHGVSIGAHPGLPDLAGFGRRSMDVAPADIEDLVLYQVCALMGLARAAGTTLRHVKAHGALYNMGWRQPSVADAIARAVAQADRSLLFFAPPHSALMAAGQGQGLRCIAEGFVDRSYTPDGSLVPRRMSGSVLANVDEIVARAMRIVREQEVPTTGGRPIHLPAETLCIHGDHSGAAAVATRIRKALSEAGVAVEAPNTVL